MKMVLPLYNSCMGVNWSGLVIFNQLPAMKKNTWVKNQNFLNIKTTLNFLFGLYY